MHRMAPLLSIALCALQAAFSTQVSLKPPRDSGQAATELTKKSPPDTDQQARAREQKRIQNLLTVHSFADHILEFKNLTSKVRGLIAMADALWKEDESYARKLFRTALETATANGQASGTARESGDDSDTSAADFGWLRREIVARIARHDPAWARDLVMREADESRTASVFLRMAGALLEEDPQQASQYVEMSVKAGFDPDIVSILLVLRSKDPATADAFFLKALQGLAAQPHVDANQLVFFSQYVLAPEQALMDSATWVVKAGNHALYNFSAVQSNASTAALRAYLETAASILSRPVSASFDKEENYLAACLLLPKVRQFAPDRAAQLEAAMRDLAPDISSDLTEDAIRTSLKVTPLAEPDTLDAARKDVDSIHDDAIRDGRCITLSYGFYQKGNFDAARAIAGEVKDLAARDKLLLLLAFEEAARLVERGRLNEAAAMATKLTPSLERAILWLGIAHGQIEHGDTKLASQTINWSLTEASRLQDPRRAVLILRAAADLAGFDPVMASQTMTEAVRTFNHVSPYAPLKTRWVVELSGRQPWLSLPLQIAGLDFQLGRMLGPLAKIDMDTTIFEVISLEDEEARGQGLAALASLILGEKPANNQMVPSCQPGTTHSL